MRWPLHSSAVRLLLEVAQRSLPGRLGQREDGPARRHAAGGDAEAQLVLASVRDHEQAARLVAGQRPLQPLAKCGVRGRAVGEHEPLPIEDEEGPHRQPGPGLLDLLVQALDVELVERVEQVDPEIARRAAGGALVVGSPRRGHLVAQLGLDERHLGERDRARGQQGHGHQGEREGRDVGRVALVDAGSSHQRLRVGSSTGAQSRTAWRCSGVRRSKRVTTACVRAARPASSWSRPSRTCSSAAPGGRGEAAADRDQGALDRSAALEDAQPGPDLLGQRLPVALVESTGVALAVEHPHRLVDLGQREHVAHGRGVGGRVVGRHEPEARPRELGARQRESGGRAQHLQHERAAAQVGELPDRALLAREEDALVLALSAAHDQQRRVEAAAALPQHQRRKDTLQDEVHVRSRDPLREVVEVPCDHELADADPRGCQAPPQLLQQRRVGVEHPVRLVLLLGDHAKAQRDRRPCRGGRARRRPGEGRGRQHRQRHPACDPAPHLGPDCTVAGAAAPR